MCARVPGARSGGRGAPGTRGRRAGDAVGVGLGAPREGHDDVRTALGVGVPDQLEQDGVSVRTTEQEAADGLDPGWVAVLDVQRDAAGVGHDDVGGGGGLLQASLHQFLRHVDRVVGDGEAVVRHDHDVGPVGDLELLELLQHPSDVAVVIADRGRGLWRADSVLVLGAIGLGHPGQHDVRVQVGQDVVIESADHVVDLARPRVGRRRSEPALHLLANVGRERAGAVFGPGIDHDAGAVRGSRVEQQAGPRRARPDGDKPLALRLQSLTKGLGRRETTVVGVRDRPANDNSPISKRPVSRSDTPPPALTSLGASLRVVSRLDASANHC